jgi:hypothetical protein
MTSKDQSLGSNTSPATQTRQDSVVRPTMLRKLASVSSHRKLVFLTPLTSYIQCTPLGVKPEPEGVQDLASVAGSSQALWDEWARYQSNLRQPDGPGMQLSHTCYEMLALTSP